MPEQSLYRFINLATSRRGFCVITAALVTVKVVNILREFRQSSPYTPSTSWKLAVQRWLLDTFRKNISVSLYPLDFIPDVKPTRTNDNGHPIAGAVRDAARRAITSAIDSMGYSKLEINPAGKTLDDERRIHPQIAPGDLGLDFKMDPPQEGDCIVAIDTDYYVEDWDSVLGGGNPAIFHTFAPTKVSGYDGECDFTIRGDTVQYNVPGGGGWNHKIWNWCDFGEFVVFNSTRYGGWKQRLARMLGFRRRVVYKIHHARPWAACPDRALVWLLPQFSLWDHELIHCGLSVRQLTRVTFTDQARPNWNIVAHTSSGNKTGEGVKMVNFGRQGELGNATLLKEQFEMLMGLGSEQSVTTRCLQMKIVDQPRLSLIGQYYKNAVGLTNNPADMARPHQMRVHWPLTSYADRPEVNYRSYSSPIISDVNMVPMIKRWESLSASIDARITKFENNVPITPKYQNFYHEFAHLVVPGFLAGTGEPYSWEEAATLLNKPSQVIAVRRVWETLDAPHRQKIEAFLKKEPTMKNGRIISSFADARFLLGFARYTLSFRDVVLHSETNKHWFCPGLTPSEIAATVQEYVSNVARVVEGDFANLDGSTSRGMQYGVRQAAFRFFNRCHHVEMRTYWDMLISCPAFAKSFGFAYDPGPGVRSGSPTTCDENTAQNAFTQYCAIRTTMLHLSKEEAFGMIGLCFGDDSLFDQRFKKNWTKTCKELGMELKVENCMPDTGVTFLARVFPDPWVTATSFQDPLRTLRKLHLTGRDPNVPLGSAAIDRLRGYLVTDGKTPVISEYCSAVVSWYENQEDAECQEKREGRASRLSEKPYWLTMGGSWPQEEEDKDLMLRCFSSRTGLSAEVLSLLARQFGNPQFTPWDEFTINRDEGPVEYKNTLDPDGLPVSSVDIRQLQTEQDNVNQRAMQISAGTPNPAGATGKGLGIPDQQSQATAGRQREEGHQSPPSLCTQGGGDGKQGDSSPAGQTYRQRVSGTGRGRGRGGTKPPGSVTREDPGTFDKSRTGGTRGGFRGRGRGQFR